MKVSIQRIAYRRWEHCLIGNWLAQSAVLPLTNPRFTDVRLSMGVVDYADVAVARNIALARAVANGCDVLVMTDDDTVPHRNFLPVALEHLRSHPDSVVVAPVCGARPERLVNISYCTEAGSELVRASRDAARRKFGLEKIWCGGGGTVAIGLKCLERLGALVPPYFCQVYNADHTAIDMTEDMYFTGRLSEAGGDVFAAWDCWSLHCKQEEIDKPEVER